MVKEVQDIEGEGIDMTDQNNHQGGPAGDPLGLVSRLVEAWADPDLSLLNHGAKDAGSAADIAAYELAAAVGWSRLAGVNPEETHNHVMSPEIIKAAAREQIKRSHLLVEAVKTAGTTWDAADSQFEKDEIICSVLEGRMDAWAADVAIEEACVADGITGEQFAVLHRWLMRPRTRCRILTTHCLRRGHFSVLC